MAELSPEEQRDLADNAKSRDERLALIEQSLDIEAELRDSPVWRYLRHRIEQEKVEIATGLAAASPADFPVIAKLQARAMAVLSIGGWITELVRAARAAEHEILVEDGRLPADE